MYDTVFYLSCYVDTRPGCLLMMVMMFLCRFLCYFVCLYIHVHGHILCFAVWCDSGTDCVFSVSGTDGYDVLCCLTIPIVPLSKYVLCFAVQ